MRDLDPQVLIPAGDGRSGCHRNAPLPRKEDPSTGQDSSGVGEEESLEPRVQPEVSARSGQAVGSE